MNDQLTDRQAKIMRCIRDYIADTGVSPTVREVGQRVGLSSSSSVACQLGRLEERGSVPQRPTVAELPHQLISAQPRHRDDGMPGRSGQHFDHQALTCGAVRGTSARPGAVRGP